MTIVIGQIESLKSVKAELYQKGISRFSSVGEINAFVRGYESEIQSISSQVKNTFSTEIRDLEADIMKLKTDYEQQKANESNRLRGDIDRLNSRCELIRLRNKNALKQAIDSFELAILKSKISKLERNFDLNIIEKTFAIDEEIREKKKRLIENTINKEKVISNRVVTKTKELTHTKEVVDGIYPLIAGAVGENLVVKELKKLSDKNTLFNDFSINFDKPIYNRKEDERIYSIQIDHLLVSNAGVFVIETKNWSKDSLNNYDLRSPIQQIRRTSFALFVLLNSESSRLTGHHWGERQIPIKNLVVMINHKPKEKFKHVAVKTLKEINRYINYFDSIFDDDEVCGIVEYLENLKDQNNIAINVNQKSRGLSNTRRNKSKVSPKPNLQKWLKSNPGKGVNDYYSKFSR